MNAKVVIGFIISLIAIYYGSVRMNFRDVGKNAIKDDPIVSNYIGDMVDFSMKNSADVPTCTGEDCKIKKRYLFTATGREKMMYIAADYNTETKRISRQVYCDKSGKVLADPHFVGGSCR